MTDHHLSVVKRDTDLSIRSRLTVQRHQKGGFFSFPLLPPSHQTESAIQGAQFPFCKVILSKDQRAALKEILSHALKHSQVKVAVSPSGISV